ncbi:hypothetical protein ACHAXT_009512 [Thalassiosira profunda]
MDIRNFFGSSGKKKPESGSAGKPPSAKKAEASPSVPSSAKKGGRGGKNGNKRAAAKDAASTGSETDSDNSNDIRVPASKSTAARRSPPKATATNKKAAPQMKKVDAFASSSDEEEGPAKNNGGGKKRSISSGARGNYYDSDSSGDERREAEMRRARENAKRAKLALGEAVEEDKEEDTKVGRAVKEMQEELKMNMGTPRKRKEPASSSDEEMVHAKNDGGKRKGRRQIAVDSDSDDSAFEVKTKRGRKGAAKKKAVVDGEDSDDDFKPAGADGDSDDDHLDADEYGSEEEEEEEKPKKKRRAASPKKKKAAAPKKKASSKKKEAAKKEPEPEGPPKYHPPSSKLTSKIPYLENNPKVPPLTKAPALPNLPKNDPNFDIDAFTPRCLEGLTFVFSGILSTNAPKTIATSANVGMNSPTKGDYYANRNLDCADDNCELSREAASDVVKSLGGRVTSAVSGKTDYLVLGCVLEDGRGPEEGSKYRKATEVWETWENKYRKEYGYGSDSDDEGSDGDDGGKKKKGKKKKSAAKDRDPNTLVEVVRGIYEFYGLVAFLSEWKKGTLGEEERAAVEAATPAKTEAAAVKSEAAAAKPAAVANPYAAKKPVANPYAQKKPANPYASASKPVNPYASAGKPANPYAKSASASAPAPAPAKAAPPKRELGANALWADKYAPAATGEILGNADSVNKLKRWLNNWENVFNNPKRPVKSLSGPNGPWKAALLSGPPGIGKTTTATLVGQESGRDVLELNASDARSKKALSQALGDVTGSQVLSFGNMGKKKGKTVAPPRRVVIMDEVDGMGAGDRSGMSELIQMIKKSKVPIICICNDRSSQKMKSLTQYCMDLRYRRPTKMVIARRAVEIGKREGMEVEPNAAEAISESCGNDIRQVLNCLQMWSCKGKAGGGGSASMTYRDLKERQSAIKKDEVLRVSMFDACKQIVEGGRGLAGADAKAATASLLKRTDAFFVDYMLMGLMVHQNYLKVCSGQFNNAKLSGDEDEEAKALESIYQATEAMSDFGMCEENLRGGDQNWSLLPLCSVLAVKVGHHAGGPSGGFLPGYAEFAGWLGKNSTRNKKIRLLQELRRHMNYKISADAPELRMTYLPMVRQQFQQLLFAEGGAKVPEAIALMDEYGLDRDDVFENLDEFVFNSPSKEKKFGDLDSKSKAAFTRAYNAMAHTSQALVAEQGAEKTARKKGNGGGAAAETAELDVCDDDKAAAEESEDDTEEDLEALTKKFLKKGRKKAAPKSKGKGAKGKKK